MGQRLQDDGAPGQVRQRRLDLGRDARHETRVGDHQDRPANQAHARPGRAGPVRRKRGFGPGICNHHDLGRPGRHVQRRARRIQRHGLLGGGYPGVAGPEDLVDLGDGVGAIGHGRDGLGAADLEDVCHAAGARSRYHGRVGTPVCARWRAHDANGAAGQLGGNSQHDGGGGQRCAAGRHIETDGPDRARSPVRRSPRERSPPAERCVELRRVKAANVG